MFLLKLILKILVCPVMIVLMLIGWILAFLIGFSSIVFYVLAGLFLMTAVITYLMGITAGSEVLKMIAVEYEIKKDRLSIRLLPPYSEARREAIGQIGRTKGFGSVRQKVTASADTIG